MRRLAPYLAVALVYVMTPSANEIAENVAHLFAEGHTAHAVSDSEHQPESPEHGCSATFHTCACHHGTSFLVGEHAVSFTAPPLLPAPPLFGATGRPAEGHPGGVFRPPIG